MTTATMPETRIILPDTSLCAIVRDELNNAAWGIIDFVDSTLPYVEAAVIVDTGSEDGTREALEELKAKYPNLEVLDLKFQGFAHARNFSLDHCKTRRALVLDADERFTRDDFGVLAEEISATDREFHSFEFLDVYENGDEVVRVYNNPRLFDAGKIGFEMEVGEFMVWKNEWKGCMVNYDSKPFSKVRIKHFRSTEEARKQKNVQFYFPILHRRDNHVQYKTTEELRKAILEECPPLITLPCFGDVRKYNPYRELYR